MDPRAGELLRDMHHPPVGAIDPDPILVVQRVEEGFVERADPARDGRPPEGGRLADAALMHQPLEGVVGGWVRPNDVVLLVKQSSSTVDEIPVWMLLKVPDNRLDSGW